MIVTHVCIYDNKNASNNNSSNNTTTITTNHNNTNNNDTNSYTMHYNNLDAPVAARRPLFGHVPHSLKCARSK